MMPLTMEKAIRSYQNIWSARLHDATTYLKIYNVCYDSNSIKKGVDEK